MARTAIEPVDIFPSSAEYDFSSSGDFSTLNTGDDNGVTFPWKTTLFLALRNNTGSPANFTIKIPTPTDLDKYTTIVDDSVLVADGDISFYKISQVLKQSDFKVYVDCDVAAELLPVKTFTNA